MYDRVDQNENRYLYKVYRNITCLGILLHVVYAVMFFFFQDHVGFLYNIGSVVFYSLMLYMAIYKKNYALVVSMIHVESSVFVAYHTLLYGWEGSFYMLLVAMASLVYFCPYRRTYIPYLISLGHFLLFFVLRIYTHNFFPVFSVDQLFIQLFFFCNCLGSFVVILYVAFVSKVSAAVSKKELLKKNDTLLQAANYDQLTGLFSRHLLKERYQQCIDDTMALAIGDIDDFKAVNDAYGHICGDVVLKELSELMRQYLDPNVFLCRWGGEEFVLVFPTGELVEVKQEMIKFCKIVENHTFQYQHIKFHITMTFGLSVGNEGITLNQWIEQADQLLYEGKHCGKNTVLSL